MKIFGYTLVRTDFYNKLIDNNNRYHYLTKYSNWPNQGFVLKMFQRITQGNDFWAIRQEFDRNLEEYCKKVNEGK